VGAAVRDLWFKLDEPVVFLETMARLDSFEALLAVLADLP
jgi:hypothetical protein